MSRKETLEYKRERLYREEQKNPTGNFNDNLIAHKQVCLILLE